MKKHLSWNNIPKIKPEQTEIIDSTDYKMAKLVSPYTIYGLGKSYGDVCLTEEGTLLISKGLDRLIEFNVMKGTIKSESGVSLDEILRLITHEGWFIPVVPGTRFITIGGALANDIHGKNHHKTGSFGNYVRKFELLRSDGERIVCSEKNNQELFYATIGGLGLTGLITWVEIDLISIANKFMQTRRDRFEHLDDYWLLNEQLEDKWDYTVAWIDCMAREESLGRGVFHSGNHSVQEDSLPKYRGIRLPFPMELPFSLVTNLESKLVNNLYYKLNSRKEDLLKHYQPFFFPLDSINSWNRVYGKRGFFQYQCVIPPENSKVGAKEILRTIKKSNQNSYLGVLKDFGDIRSKGLLSFPRPGTTLALDFPNKGEETLELFNKLDSIVSEFKGALYPAKDARMSGEMFRASFPKHEEFSKFIDPKFSSNFWKRVSE